MKKILLFAIVVVSFAACNNKPTPQKIVEEFMREHAYHPDQMKMLSCNAVLRPERTKLDTFYHISSVDGTECKHLYSWRDVKSISYDSIRIETHQYPEHYYCSATFDCVNDCGDKVQGSEEFAVFTDGSAMFYDEYRDKYYYSYTATTFAQFGTLTDVRARIDLSNYCGGWGLKQMLLNFHAPAE